MITAGGSFCRNLLRQPFRFFLVSLVLQKLVNINQSLSANDPLGAHSRMSLQQIIQQVHLQVIPGRKIDMPPLRGKRPVFPVIPEEPDFAQSRARRDDGSISRMRPGRPD